MRIHRTDKPANQAPGGDAPFRPHRWWPSSMTASVGCRLPATGGLPQAPRGGFQVSQAHNCPLKRAARRSAAPKIRTSSGLVRISPCGLGRGAQRNSWSCAGARASGRQRFGWRAGRASDAKMAILEAGRSRGRRRLVSAVRAPLGGARHGQRLVLVFNGARPGTGVRDQASPGRLARIDHRFRQNPVKRCVH